MKLEPDQKTTWRIGNQSGADVPLTFVDSEPPANAEIRWQEGKFHIRATDEGEVRLNRTGIIEGPLPAACYLWFGPHRFRWEKSSLTESPVKGYLYLDNLRVQKGSKVILQRLSFGIDHETGMTGIFGPSGCGKSTLIKELLDPPTEDPPEIIRHPDSTLGYIPQEDTLPHYLTVEECLIHSILFREPTLPLESAKSKASELTNLLGLTPYQQQTIDKLSGGQRKRVSVAMELGGEPDILLLDEPTTGLDPQSQKLVMDHLKMISKDRDITIICVTHALETISYFDQIVILRPLADKPESDESSLCYAGPNNPDTVSEVCQLFDLEQFNEVFLPQPQQEPTNRTPSGRDFARKKNSPQYSPLAEAKDLLDKKQLPSRAKQTGIIAWRSILQVLRNRTSLAITLLLPVLIGILIFVAESQAGDGDVRGGRLGLFLYSGITDMWLGMTLVIRTIVGEKSICRRDIRTGLQPFCYGLGKITFLAMGALSQTILLTGTLIVIHILAPFALELRIPWPAPGLIFTFGMLLFLMVMGGGFLGLAVSAWAKKEYVAISILPLLMIPHLLFNMGAYEPSGRYNPGEAYNPVFWNSADGSLRESDDLRAKIHYTVSLPLLSRPFLNIMEGRAAAIIRNKVESGVEVAAEHPSQRIITPIPESNASNDNEPKGQLHHFRSEWSYFLILLAAHAALAGIAFFLFLPRRNPQKQQQES